jgi:putative hemolysin
MDLKFWLEIVLIFILVFVSGFFSASESFFAIVQVGMTVTASAASALGGATAILVIKPLIESVPIVAINRAAESISIILVVIVISYLFLVLAELVPKALAIRYSERIALWVGPGTWWSLRVVGIFIRFLSWSTNLCLRVAGISTEIRRETMVTEEEVKIILTDGLKQGVFEPHEQRMISSLFEFSDTVARNAMTPRIEMLAIEIGEKPEEILKTATMEPYSRLPVYEENLDNIKGILNVRDLLTVFRTGGLIVVKDIMREPLFVPDSKKISEILKDMKIRKTHMAIVLDEFGGTAGLITLEDILEEIVGEIQDEYDLEEEAIVMQPDGSAIVKGSVEAEVVCDKFKVDLPDGEFETITGMIMNKLDRIPERNEVVEISGLRITVLEKANHRVKKLRVEKIPE